MTSPDHQALRLRIDELANRFVDFDIPLDREPSSHELDMIAAFKLLVHAELESFIEQRIQSALDNGLTRWESDRRVSRVLFGLLLKWYPHFPKEKNPLSVSQPHNKMCEVMKIALSRAKNEINENNGIRKDSFFRMCYSAGILTDDVSATLVASLDSYGKIRGDVAHNPVGKVKTLNDPRVEAEEAKNIVKYLEELDSLVDSYCM